MGINKGEEGIEANTSDQNGTTTTVSKPMKSGRPAVVEGGEDEAPDDEAETTK